MKKSNQKPSSSEEPVQAKMRGGSPGGRKVRSGQVASFHGSTVYTRLSVVDINRRFIHTAHNRKVSNAIQYFVAQSTRMPDDVVIVCITNPVTQPLNGGIFSKVKLR